MKRKQHVWYFKLKQGYEIGAKASVSQNDPTIYIATSGIIL
jgi:hypothetical protein